MLRGRLGLETARMPHTDRHGLLYLSRGALKVKNGTLFFSTKEQEANSNIPNGSFDIPFQTVSIILLGPGTTVSHDAFRLLARHGTALVAVGEYGVRAYTAPPLMSDQSVWARRQMRFWADENGDRIRVARQMYYWRFDEMLPHRDLDTLRGMEGARVKKIYANLSQQYGITWRGRRYDRLHPDKADIPNQAINHCSSAVEAAAIIAVYSTATIPQIGFIHSDSGISFVLDIADLFRDSVTIPCAFQAAAQYTKTRDGTIERIARQTVGNALNKQNIIAKMIDGIKLLLDEKIEESGDDK